MGDDSYRPLEKRKRYGWEEGGKLIELGNKLL